MRYYAGIGARQTPPDILVLMVQAARRLAQDGWTLRTGGAPGADEAFMQGAGDACEVYLPWAGFNTRGQVVGDHPAFLGLAARHHPAWSACSPAARALHARNVAIVLGAVPRRTELCRFVLCWTRKGEGGGGTGQGIRIARAHGIVVKDLGLRVERERIEQWLARSPSTPD